MIPCFLFQKGAARKSTLARLVAVEFIEAGCKVHVTDLDAQLCSPF